MSTEPDLSYDPTTLLGPVERSRITEFEDYLATGDVAMPLDAAYLSHIVRFHGGIPGRRTCTTSSGRQKVIERFLNFVDYKSEPEIGWYNVEVTWSQLADRLGDFLLPFAALFGGDFLCFDYSAPGRPRVVVWLHEESRIGEPSIDHVACDFDELLESLQPM